MKIKKLAMTAAGLLLGLVIAAAPAYSSPLWSFQDDAIHAVLRCPTATTCSVLTSGVVQNGDIFYTVFKFPTFTIDGVNAIPAGQQLTGVLVVQLLIGAGTSSFTFGAYANL